MPTQPGGKGSGRWGELMLGTGQVGRQPQGRPSTVAGGKKGPRAGWLKFADLMALCCFRFSGGEGATLGRGGAGLWG